MHVRVPDLWRIFHLEPTVHAEYEPTQTIVFPAVKLPKSLGFSQVSLAPKCPPTLAIYRSFTLALHGAEA